jgi:hypothetical protein
MVNNSTNINKTKYHLFFQTVFALIFFTYFPESQI